MAKTVKEKNIIKFYLDDSKPNNYYSLDINTGVLYGVKGSPIKRTPNGMNNFMEYHSENTCVLRYMRRVHYWNSVSYAEFHRFASELQICDKLDSIGYVPSDVCELTSRVKLNFVNENFKEFVKYLAEELAENERHTIGNFKSRYEVKAFAKQYHIEVSEYFPEEWIRYLVGCAFTEKQNACAIYYFKKGLYYVLDYRTDDLLKSMFKYCDMLGKEYPKGDFIREYATLKKEYEFRKEELDNEAILNNQMKKSSALSFRYDTLEAIVPTTTEEFYKEADEQSNCVARSYMPRVIRDETNIVFIRRIDDIEKSYITCEVRDGKIVQYLGRYNSWLGDDEIAMEFKAEYKKHLDETWVW